MYVCMYVCMYGPVSRVPESVSLGDHTIGGARDPESGLIYIYVCVYFTYVYIYTNLYTMSVTNYCIAMFDFFCIYIYIYTDL